MTLPTKHIRHQLPVIASLGGTVWSAVRQNLGLGRKQAGAPQTPGPTITQTIPPRPADLVRDYVRHCGGDPGAYRGILPAHLFPQWGFPLAARTLEGIPYPMQKVLNGGCRLEVRAPLPADQPLVVTARLEDIDDNGKRAVLHQRVVTGTRDVPEAVIGDLYAIVPLGGGPEKNGKHAKNGHGAREKRDHPRVPQDATELAYWRIPADAGLAFAMLTGDFNPVHWVPAYARAFGFKSTILHGFSTMARAIEGIGRARFAGDAQRIRGFDCKFTRPLVLPARVGLYVQGDQVFVGDAPGGAAYLVGTYSTSSGGN